MGGNIRDEITQQIIDAIEGHKPLFECQEIRQRCAVFDTAAPDWATSGVCGVHQVMLKAEKAMRDELADMVRAGKSVLPEDAGACGNVGHG